MDFANQLFAKYGLQNNSANNDGSFARVTPPTPQHSGFNAGALPGQIGNAVGAIGSGIAQGIADPFEHIYKSISTANTVSQRSQDINSRSDALQKQVMGLHTQYSNGQINKAQWQSSLHDLNGQYDQISTDAHSNVDNSKNIDSGAALAGYTASALATVLPGFNIAKDAVIGTKVASALAAAAEGGNAAAKAAQIAVKGTNMAVNSLTNAGQGNIIKNALHGALINSSNVQLAGQIGGNIASGDYKGAAEKAGLAGAIGAAPAVLGAAGKAIGHAFFDTTGVLDHIVGSDGSISNYIKTVQSKFDQGLISQTKLNTEMNKAKVLQADLLQQHGSPEAAQHAFAQQYDGATPMAKNYTAEQLLNHAAAQHAARRDIQANAAKGLYATGDGNQITAEMSGRMTAGRVSASSASHIMNAFNPEGSKEDWLNTVSQLKADGHLATAPIQTAIESIAGRSKNFQELKANLSTALNGTSPIYEHNPLGAVKSTGSATLDALNSEAAGSAAPQVATGKNGYEVHMMGEGTTLHPLPRAQDVPSVTMGSEAKLGGVGRFLQRNGLSPESAPPGFAQSVVRDHAAAGIDNIPGLEGYGRQIYDALHEAAIKNPTVGDARFLSNKEAGVALDGVIKNTKIGVGAGGTADILKAINKGYAQTDREVRGLGPHMLDKAFNSVPGLKTYSRIQSVGRYGALNPFFQVKRISKSGIIAGLEGHGLAKATDPGVTGMVRQAAKGTELDNAGSGLENATVSNKPSTNFIGKGAENVSPGFVGNVQQKMAESMVQNLLNRAGVTAKDVNTVPGLQHTIDHAVQSVYGYPKDGYLSSNLAKTLNVAVFPSRFETKVVTAGVKFLATQNPMTRVALVNQIMNAQGWMDSPDGKAWQQKNSELIGVAKYISPVGSLEDAYHAISGKSEGGFHLQDLGQLGGLPFGIIGTMLQHQGVDFGSFGSSPYRDPKTGLLVPEKIPTTVKAGMQQGLTDLVGSMFSYPGASLGLNSKTKEIQGILPILKPGAGETRSVGGETAPAANASTSTQRTMLAGNSRLGTDRYAIGSGGKAKKAKTFASRPSGSTGY